MNPISTDDQLPDAHDFILWWHPRTRDWRIGLFRTRGDRHAPGFFQGEGAWYIEDGPTWWMPTPPDPTVNKWKAIAQAEIDEHGTVTAEEARELNEPYKEAIIAAVDAERKLLPLQQEEDEYGQLAASTLDCRTCTWFECEWTSPQLC